jgi:hypothetical protein
MTSQSICLSTYIGGSHCLTGLIFSLLTISHVAPLKPPLSVNRSFASPPPVWLSLFLGLFCPPDACSFGSFCLSARSSHLSGCRSCLLQKGFRQRTVLQKVRGVLLQQYVLEPSCAWELKWVCSDWVSSPFMHVFANICLANSRNAHQNILSRYPKKINAHATSCHAVVECAVV